MKEKSGITLIALVITVIVLLILAGTAVSIGLNGDNIFKNADNAKQDSNDKSLVEAATSAVALCKYIETNGDTFKQKLESQMAGANIIEVQGKTDVVLVEKGGSTVTAYENGDILVGETKFWDGSTIECPKITEENGVYNWYISTPAQLKFLADFVNNGNTTEGSTLASLVPSGTTVSMTPQTTIYLMNNLDLGARPGAGATEAEKWASNVNWTPIGINPSNVQNKLGTFEGNGYCIKGVYVDRGTNNYAGLFGISNVVKNLTIKDSFIKGQNVVAGISGYIINGTIENCHNVNTYVFSTRSTVRRRNYSND